MSDPGFYIHLRSNAQVAALIGDRIYLVRAPQRAPRPYLVWMRGGIARQQMYCGVCAVVNAQYEFSCYGATPDEAQALHHAVRKAMQDFAGLMGDVEVKHCFLVEDFLTEDDDPNLYSVRQLWQVHYVEV